MKKVYRITVIALLAIFLGTIAYMNLGEPRNVDIKVNKIERIERVTTVNKELSTDIYYLVFSDKGTFRVSIDGLFASPGIIGELKEDSSYTARVMGIDIPVLGIYSNIVSIENK